MTKDLRKKLLISIAFTGIIYLGFSVYADLDQLLISFSKFNWFLIPILLTLSLLNYYSRFVKWNYYLKLIEVKLSLRDSFSIFCSGLIMSITPGKFGEVFKSYLIKQINDEPISKTAPVVFAERITDFLSLVIISLIGAYIFDYGRVTILIIGSIIFIIILFITNKYLVEKFLIIVSKISFLNKHLEKFINLFKSSEKLLSPKPLIKMIGLSIVSWGFECLAYFLILFSFNIDVSILWASFAYAFATIVGAVSMLPGGLGVTEGSLSYLVIAQGYSKDISFASTFIIRVVTLWFAVFIGIISVIVYQKKFGEIKL